MSKKEEAAVNSRRNFLKFAAVSAPVAVATVAAGTSAQAVELNQKGSGVRDTAHTKAYFESAKF